MAKPSLKQQPEQASQETFSPVFTQRGTSRVSALRLAPVCPRGSPAAQSTEQGPSTGPGACRPDSAIDLLAALGKCPPIFKPWFPLLQSGVIPVSRGSYENLFEGSGP